MRRLAAVLLFGLWAALAGATEGLVPLPQLKARVTDLTATLDIEQRQALETRLTAFEARKGSQISVLLLPTTQPEAIEQFGIRLAEAWKIGRAGIDDGVIIIVAKEDRALRIEVGYGLEGALNDATAKRIVSEIMGPQLRQGDYFAALQAGVDAVIGVVEKESLPVAASVKRPERSISAEDGFPFGISENLLLIGVAGIAIGGAVVRFFLGNLLGAGLVGSVTGVIGWLLVGSLTGVLIGVVGGFILAMFGLDILFSIVLNRGGGWSGGGGGFGGGGASGRW